MRTKRVYLTESERLAVQTMIAMEIKFNRKAKEMNVEPVFDTERLKALYKKLAGLEWEEDQRR